MTTSEFPPPPKVRESRFDDWMFRFYKHNDVGAGSSKWTASGSDIYRNSSVGIGATPPSGQSSGTPMLYMDGGVIGFTSSNSGVSNAYYDGANWKRIATGRATALNHGSGGLQFYGSASSTAGTTISFLRFLDIDTDGKVGIGTSTPGGYLAITSGNTARAIQVTQSVTQAVNSNLYNEISVTETNADVGANIMNALRLNHVVTGTSTTGARNSFEVLLTHSTATASGNTLRYYCAAAFVSYSMVGDGGSSGNYKGAYYGINPVAVLGDGGSNDATWVANVTAVEANIAVRTGSDCYYKAGIQIAGAVDDAVQGTGYDAMLSLSSQGGVGWKNGILFSPANGAAPLDATVGTLIKTEGTDSIYRGIDVSTYGFSSWAVYMKNTTNAAGANGIYIEIQYGADTGTVLEATVQGRSDPSLRVNGETADPVWITVNSTFRKVVAGASDSGGTGYRLLRVAN